jgi:hypothetical protein
MKKYLSLVQSAVVVAGVVFSATLASAQAIKTGSDVKTSRLDIYGGVGDIQPFYGSINEHAYKGVGLPNATFGISYYFKRNLGIELEAGSFQGPATGGKIGQQYVALIGGPVLRFPLGHFIPFVHIMGGGARVNGPVDQPLTWGYEAGGGVGLDYVLPWFHGALALRLPQVDFQEYRVPFPTSVIPLPDYNGTANLKAVKGLAGVTLRLGDREPTRPLTASCDVSPSTLYPGDPITVSGSLVNINPRKKAVWTWATSGGQLTPSDGGASIATTGLAPGDYTVTGKVSQGKKPMDKASCMGTFTVKPFEPPTVSCSADPGTIMPGTPVSITANGMSPQNRMLTYAYSTTAGQLTNSGSHASLATAGVGPGTIGITCNVVDDLGKSATASTSVTVSTPPVLAMPEARSLCTVSFERDRKRPARVDNEGKGCLDDVALTLNHDATSKLVVVGSSAPDESPSIAAGRAFNIYTYLTQEKGIDPSRIELREGAPTGRRAEDFLLPSGALYPNAGATILDPSTIHVTGPAYGTGTTSTVARKHRRKKKVY